MLWGSSRPRSTRWGYPRRQPCSFGLLGNISQAIAGGTRLALFLWLGRRFPSPRVLGQLPCRHSLQRLGWQTHQFWPHTWGSTPNWPRFRLGTLHTSSSLILSTRFRIYRPVGPIISISAGKTTTCRVSLSAARNRLEQRARVSLCLSPRKRTSSRMRSRTTIRHEEAEIVLARSICPSTFFVLQSQEAPGGHGDAAQPVRRTPPFRMARRVYSNKVVYGGHRR